MWLIISLIFMYCMLTKCQSSVDEVSIEMSLECQSRCQLRVDQGHWSKHAFRTHNLNSLYCFPYICHRIYLGEGVLVVNTSFDSFHSSPTWKWTGTWRSTSPQLHLVRAIFRYLFAACLCLSELVVCWLLWHHDNKSCAYSWSKGLSGELVYSLCIWRGSCC